MLGEQRLREHSVVAHHRRMVREVGVAHQRTDAEATAGKRFDLVERQAVDVDDLLRTLDVQLHEVEKIGSPGDEADGRAELRRRRGETGLDGLRGCRCAAELEWLHGVLL
jgi:hypothetical protein